MSITSKCLVLNPQWENHSNPIGAKNNFGIFKINISEIPCKFEEFNIILTVDRSGSMSDLCNDNKTKMRKPTQDGYRLGKRLYM